MKNNKKPNPEMIHVVAVSSGALPSTAGERKLETPTNLKNTHTHTPSCWWEAQSMQH